VPEAVPSDIFRHGGRDGRSQAFDSGIRAGSASTVCGASYHQHKPKAVLFVLVRTAADEGLGGAGNQCDIKNLFGWHAAVCFADLVANEAHRGVAIRSRDAMLSISKEMMMRIPALAILTTVTILMAAPTLAQTYSPDYPVCLKVVSRHGGLYIECGYTSLAQCAQSASGRAAQCVINPYYAGTTASPGRRDRRHPRLY
jgi:Protein of unknown function (DUF3551)